ncbi:MAG: hypothetical protein O7B81_00035 [Gammaproteobacteria bacterium]|nr:hypothetical protein [Gammaproteobacteria bacterium]
MADQKSCIRCGGTELSSGSLQSTGKAYFRLARTKFLASKTSDLTVDGEICIACGHIDLVGDAEKARSLVGV